MFRLSLVPIDRKFSILFQQGTANVVKMAKELKDLVYLWENVRERAKVLADLERDGDAITHEIMALLNRSFITPFDREDIAALAHALDDVADRIETTADTMLLYKLEGPTEKAKEMADIILQVTLEVQKAVSGIAGRIDHKSLLKQCVEINRLENIGDGVYRSSLAGLFADSADILYVIKWREIYDDLESSIDGCEVVANVLEGVALKYS